MVAFESMDNFDEPRRKRIPHPPLHARAVGLAEAMRQSHALDPVLENRYLVKGWLDRGAFSVVYGESNVGKTFLAMDIAVHVAAGEDWHGHRVQDGKKWAGPVLYIASEGGAGINNRLAALRRSKQDMMNAVEGNGDLYILSAPIDLCTADDARYLADVIKVDFYRKPALIVVDTLARAMGNGDENTAKDMGQFIRSIDYLREETGAHVMVVHHSGKDASKGARGSGSLRAAADTEIELTRVDGIIMAETRKQRDMTCDAVFAYSLKSVFIGMDDDGEKVTSAVVQPAEPVKRKVKLTGTDKIALQALDDCIRDHGQQLTSPNYPSNRRCVSLDRWREYCDRHSLSSGEGESSRRTAFHKVKNRLQEKEMVRIIDGWLWRVAPDDNRSFRSHSVPGNIGNAGHVTVPTVPAPYKGGNEGTQTQAKNKEEQEFSEDEVSLPEPKTENQESKETRSMRDQDPDAYDPEMWK